MSPVRYIESNKTSIIHQDDARKVVYQTDGKDFDCLEELEHKIEESGDMLPALGTNYIFQNQ